MAKKTPKTPPKVVERNVVELSNQTLEVARQCIAQVPVRSGQQGVLLANALLEIEALMASRGLAQPAPAAEEAPAE